LFGILEERMIIEEVAPMLTCVASNDGFQFELLLRAQEGLPAITKIRIGPYHFREEFQPKPAPFGLSKGGPESAFWMHKSAPRGWSRIRWEVAENEPGQPAYLVSNGVLSPGTQGIFKFTSFYAPGGLRIGLEVYRNAEHRDYGVSGPNYETFMKGHGY